ncbi:hypothetical protein BS47DRAFT_1295770 [Hydnum rufescens UP504]|uniref:Ketoreductase (KR) domain-containing protein n=1 Tax=Hydnum rufescens UP504 TaxID=1448309 RepID=A0A9P6AYM6_9AGAM|nr:hypothetical protein BS47DRAFT_1295770 [Hydnum rufescens UP504]
MLLQLVGFLGTIATARYAIHAGVIGITLLTLHLWVNGRENTRDRDMHGRVVVLTGAFTAVGLRVLTELADRGAQVIALTSSLSSPLVQELIPVLRQTSKNELIYAEECDLDSPASIRNFCQQLIQPRPSLDGNSPAESQRVDALVMTHEYPHVDSAPIATASSSISDVDADEHRLRPTLASFLLTTLILPSLLRAPSDRDIRIVNVVNPAYAAAIPSFSPTSLAPAKKCSTFTKEGYRSLRAIIVGRHLQRIFDALLSSPDKQAPVAPDPDADEFIRPSLLYKGSNIISVVVSPGFTMGETVTPLLASVGHTRYGFLNLLHYYIIIFPFLVIITKSTRAATQSILYALFLPHPRKVNPALSETGDSAKHQNVDGRVIEGGMLYRDCAVVALPGRSEREILEREDVGRAVWEYLEEGVKRWEEDEAQRLAEVVKDGGPTTRKKTRLSFAKDGKH